MTSAPAEAVTLTATAHDATGPRGGVGIGWVEVLCQAFDASVTVSNPTTSVYAATALAAGSARQPADLLVGAYGYGPRPVKAI